MASTYDKLGVTYPFQFYESDNPRENNLVQYLDRLVKDLRKVYSDIVSRLNYVALVVPDPVSGSFEIVKPGNKVGDDGNWLLIIDGNNLHIKVRISSVWTSAYVHERPV